MTKQEKHLWYDYLKKYPFRFFRQRIIGNYITDFYCSKVRLVVELDGSQHYQDDNAEYDEIRTEYFNSLGIKVIRFSNNECSNNFDGVCAIVDKEVKNRMR